MILLLSKSEYSRYIKRVFLINSDPYNHAFYTVLNKKPLIFSPSNTAAHSFFAMKRTPSTYTELPKKWFEIMYVPSLTVSVHVFAVVVWAQPKLAQKPLDRFLSK